MSPLATLGLSLALLGSPSRVDVAASVSNQLSGGSIPLGRDDGISLALQNSLLLRGGLQLISPRTRLEFSYAPRIFTRLPGTEQLGRPLFFHFVNADYEARLSRTWLLDALLNGGAGELAYSDVQDLFDPGTNTTTASVVSLARGDGQLNQRWLLSRRTEVSLGTGLGAQSPLDDMSGLRKFLEARGVLGVKQLVSFTDALEVSASGSYFLRDWSEPFVVLGADANWTHLPRPLERLEFRVGARAVHDVYSNLPSFVPLGSLAYSRQSGSSARPSTFDVSGGVRGFFDRFNVVYLPQAFVGSSASTRWSTEWTSAVSLFVATSATSTPLGGRPESSLIFNAPSTYRVSNQFSLVVSPRVALRGPHLSEFTTDRLQTQVLLMIGLEYHEGTDPTHGDWL